VFGYDARRFASNSPTSDTSPENALRQFKALASLVAGRFVLRATGLYHLRARQYDASSGRFLSQDPVFQSASVSGSPYAYAADGPTVMVDPTGQTLQPANDGSLAAYAATSPAGATRQFESYDSSSAKAKCAELWAKMMELAFAHRSSPGSGTKGLFDRYFGLLEVGRDPGHIEAFERQQAGLRNRLNQFRTLGCKPPGAALYRDMCWIATTRTPTEEDVRAFQLNRAIAGGGTPILTVSSSGVATLTFSTSLFVFVWIP
jgi:RHS repeat-associated protein